jgi:hypothetical protein
MFAVMFKFLPVILPFSWLTSWSWKVSKMLFFEVEGTATELWKIKNKS